jgi:hypothetical protein
MPMVLILLGLGGAGWWFFKRKSDDSDDSGDDQADAGAAPGDDASVSPIQSGGDDVTGAFTSQRYAPRSQAAYDLFTAAAQQAGLPVDWATSEALHWILQHESGGWVGIPNLQFGSYANPGQKDQWQTIWRAIQSGNWRNFIDADKYPHDKQSSATGLGQLTASNIPKYYPSGLQGIGVPLEEAIGFMKYIQDRYQTPEAAQAFWQAHNWY